MSKRKPSKNRFGRKRSTAPRQSAGGVGVRRCGDGAWELAPPRCALSRLEDLEEVQKMIDAGETEIARDELRWLLSECHDFLAAHKLLGDLALAESDLPLARGHFGYAYQLGIKAIDAAGGAQPLPYARPANRVFFEAAGALVACLVKLGKASMARSVVRRVVQLDPSDPLNLRQQATQGAARSRRPNAR